MASDEQVYLFDCKLFGGTLQVKDGAEGSTDIIIEGPVSSGDIDRDGDIVDPHAVLAAWPGYQQNPIIRFNHGREGIGIMTDVTMGTDANGNEIPVGKALIDGDEKSIVNKIKKGIYRSFSIGFRVEAKEEIKDGEDTRLKFTKIDWVETSVVDIPSNKKATFAVVKTPSNGLFSKYLAEEGNTFTYSDLMRLNETGEETIDMTDEITIQEKEDNTAVAAILDSQQEKIQLNKSEVDGLRSELTELREWKVGLEKAKAIKEAEEMEQIKVAEAVTEAGKAHSTEMTKLREELQQAKAEAAELPDRDPERKSLVDTTSPEVMPEYPEGKTALQIVAEQQNKTPGTVVGELWLIDKLGDRVDAGVY